MVFLGCDHGGFKLKQTILDYLCKKKIPVKDMGSFTGEACDYPDIAKLVCEQTLKTKNSKAILICGTGIGMSICANKFKGIRAACCSDFFSAKFTRLHNDANVLCLGERVVGVGLAIELVEIFLNTPFEGNRHINRIKKINELE